MSAFLDFFNSIKKVWNDCLFYIKTITEKAFLYNIYFFLIFKSKTWSLYKIKKMG